MAKNNSLFSGGFQGTLGGVTFVKSRRYGQHVRTKRGTYRKAKVNDTLKENNEQLASAMGPAKLIFYALRDEHKDGTLWNRLLNIYRKKIKEGAAADTSSLTGLECSLESRLEQLTTDYQYDVRVENNALHLKARLFNSPRWRKLKGVDAYRVSFLILFVSFKKNKLEGEVFQGPVTELGAEPAPMSFSFPVPAFAKEYIVLMKIEGCFEKEPLGVSIYNGMKVLATGVIE